MAYGGNGCVSLDQKHCTFAHFFSGVHYSNATYAELVAVDDWDVTHLPDGVDLADAAAIPLIALTGDQLVRLATNVQKGQVAAC